ncbi:MAG: arylamine N-acetyltransferase [Saprospiraceae bacterium]|nr:arylamine N-acetyltransferase [Saprospiraceae bacterium]
MNIERYLQRINYSGSLEPRREVLQQMQKAHLLAVPFENLDIHIGIPIELDVSRFYAKIVENNRGGFCYELNELFNDLLKSLGFNTKRISARVYSKDLGYGQEFSHLALIVIIEKMEYLVDVGFGEFSFGPLELQIGEIQNDERGNFMIDYFDNTYLRVNKITDGITTPEYIFENSERDLSEYQTLCTYHQTDRNSHFTQKKLISKPTEHGRITISGNQLKTNTGTIFTESIIKNEAEFNEMLLNYFNMKI